MREFNTEISTWHGLSAFLCLKAGDLFARFIHNIKSNRTGYICFIIFCFNDN